MIKNIFFDFDGVILDSMPIREIGFRKIFKDYTNEQIERLLEFHRINGGLSRFVKIRYFYEKILNKPITSKKVEVLANEFSSIMKKELTSKELLITDCVTFIENNFNKYSFHIVSGSEHNELNFLCKKLGINEYFITINGSPTPKNNLVKTILQEYSYKKEETILIGDSINDYNAAAYNNINFYGYNNKELISVSHIYLDKLVIED